MANKNTSPIKNFPRLHISSQTLRKPHPLPLPFPFPKTQGVPFSSFKTKDEPKKKIPQEKKRKNP